MGSVKNKEWLKKDRPDLIGDANFDPDAPSVFKDVKTWCFTSSLSISDYSYIFNANNSNLSITTKDGNIIDIPSGCVGF